MRRLATIPALLLALLALLTPAPAAASRGNEPPPIPMVARQAPPPVPVPLVVPAWLYASPGLTTVREAIRVTCNETSWPVCAIEHEAVIMLDASAPEPVGVVLQLASPRSWLGAPTSLETPGTKGPSVLTPGEARAFGARGRVFFVEESKTSERDTAISVRHMLATPPGDPIFGLALEVTSAPERRVSLDAPASWSMHFGGGPVSPTSPTGRRTIVPEAGAPLVGFARTMDISPLRRGGGFFGFGGTARAEVEGGKLQGDWISTSLRAGYEFASPQFLLHSLAVDTDFKRLTVTPAIEAVSRLGVMTFTVGAGMPVRAIGGPALGIRGQAGINASLVGVVIAVDHYPVRDRDGAVEATRLAWYLQFTF